MPHDNNSVEQVGGEGMAIVFLHTKGGKHKLPAPIVFSIGMFS